MTTLWISPDDITEELLTDEDEAAVAYASYVLFKLTGEKYSGFTTATDWYYESPVPYKMAYQSLLPFWGTSSDIYSVHIDVNESMALPLRSKPVISILSVSTGEGTVIPVNAVSLYNKGVLYRNDKKPWNFSKGVMVNYTYGTEPPEAGKVAAIELAKNIKTAITDPTSDCQLSQRVQGSLLESYQTQGVSYSFIDPQAFLSEGRTGITAVDLFIKAANPTGAIKTAKVYSPDIPRGFRK